jgi:MFS family permease
VLGYSPIATGVRFLPLSLISFFVAPAAGRLSARLPVRALLGLGLALSGGALLLMWGIDTGSGWTTLLAGFVVGGIGIGMVNPPLATIAVGVVEPRRAGMASGINNTFRQVGIATGIAALGALFQSRIRSDLVERLGERAARLAPAVASGTPTAGHGRVAQAATAAFVAGLNEILLVAAVVLFVGAACAVALVRTRDFV